MDIEHIKDAQNKDEDWNGFEKRQTPLNIKSPKRKSHKINPSSPLRGGLAVRRSGATTPTKETAWGAIAVAGTSDKWARRENSTWFGKNSSHVGVAKKRVWEKPEERGAHRNGQLCA